MPAHPPTLELSLQTALAALAVDANEARLLPRYRDAQPPTLLERRRRERAQAEAVLDALTSSPDAKLPLRHQLTKPGDPDTLRGIPAIGLSVRGVIRGTDPFDETARRDGQARKLRERTELAA